MIEQTELDMVVAHIHANGLSDNILPAIREEFPGRYFTYCTEDDIHAGKPVVEEDAFAIYLVDSREHCSKLTNDLDVASGFVIAEKIVG
ncbi:DUF6129 family protein [Teredinibacter haidensis]|uniref:DUF6129 family protein n=1 Tax=Teredinibacter haidensis TaxID=2731755 RepID=UPI000948AEFF|nr:DUF6129 family protein [Teredinibacter haidensis]